MAITWDKNAFKRRKLALLLPAHNEELIISYTITSAIMSGVRSRDIYVVDDASSDCTRLQAEKLLHKENIVTIEHSGKAGAIRKAITIFNLTKKYEWIHVADADSVFGKDYFRIYRQALSDSYVAAVGFVQSLKGNWICSYRALSYTLSQHVHKRIQAWFGMITVMPGPVTSYRSDIIDALNFDTGSFTEDFDITLQIYRFRLGKIKYIPEAVNYTQDPRNLNDFVKQVLRWYRGFFQGIKRYKIGLKRQRIDVSIALMIAELFLFVAQVSVVIYMIFYVRNYQFNIWRSLFAEVFLISLFAIFAVITTRRIRILCAIPLYHFFKVVELGAYTVAFVEVFILRKFEGAQEKGWSVADRRYALNNKSLTEILYDAPSRH